MRFSVTIHYDNYVFDEPHHSESHKYLLCYVWPITTEHFAKYFLSGALYKKTDGHFAVIFQYELW